MSASDGAADLRGPAGRSPLAVRAGPACRRPRRGRDGSGHGTGMLAGSGSGNGTVRRGVGLLPTGRIAGVLLLRQSPVLESQEPWAPRPSCSSARCD